MGTSASTAVACAPQDSVHSVSKHLASTAEGSSRKRSSSDLSHFRRRPSDSYKVEVEASDRSIASIIRRKSLGDTQHSSRRIPFFGSNSDSQIENINVKSSFITILDPTPSEEDHELLSANIVPSSLIEGQKFCSAHAELREGFVRYVQSGEWVEVIGNPILELVSKRTPASELKDFILFSDYLIGAHSQSPAVSPTKPGGEGINGNSELSSRSGRVNDEVSMMMKKCTALKVRESMGDGSPARSRGSSFCEVDTVPALFSDDQSLTAVLLSILWPFFRASTHFLEVATAVDLCLSLYDRDELLDNALATPPVPLVNRVASVKAIDAEKMRRVHDFLRQTAATLDESEALSLLASGLWLNQLSNAVENSNFSVSIASAGKNASTGFPIIFVNKAFEKMTLYPRSEVLGRNCKVLQCQRTDMRIVSQLASSLAQGSGLKVALDNVRRDGTEFKNFLAVRAVHNPAGEYKFVLGVQYDMSRGDVSYTHLRLIEDIMVLLALILRS